MELADGAHFDAVIIGAGMAGLAAGIRLALFDKNVIILERHNAPGGLNSFYSFEGRKYDVGLHALTNYTTPEKKKSPLNKLFRQLRIPREAFDLNPQFGSKIVFPDISLKFSSLISIIYQNEFKISYSILIPNLALFTIHSIKRLLYLLYDM